MTLPITIPFFTSGRAQSNAMRYFHLTADALISYRKLRQVAEAKYASIDPERPFAQDLSDLLAATEDALIMPIVLGAMCIESALYDLGACLYGDEFSARIDKLDPLAKFSVIKLLVDRKSPQLGNVTLQTIRALVVARNRLVHHKSTPVDDVRIGKVFDQARETQKVQEAGIDSSIKALVLLSLNFDGNIFEELRILPSFKNPEYWVDVVPKALHPDVHWCLDALNRQHARRDTDPSGT